MTEKEEVSNLISELFVLSCINIHSSKSFEELEQVRIELLGKKGLLIYLTKELGKMIKDDRLRN